MRIFIDTASIEHIRHAVKLGVSMKIRILFSCSWIYIIKRPFVITG